MPVLPTRRNARWMIVQLGAALRAVVALLAGPQIVETIRAVAGEDEFALFDAVDQPAEAQHDRREDEQVCE